MASNQIWSPQPGPQTLLIKCPFLDILYGGARGGGKTDGALGRSGYHIAKYAKHARVLFIRRTLKELEPVIRRAVELYKDVAVWKESKKQFHFYNGAFWQFGYLERDKDAENYQGHDYTNINIEEAGNFPNSGPIDLLRGTLRSTHGVPCSLLLTANPGGPGHNWLKARYIDPAPPLTPIHDIIKLATGGSVTSRRIFIPARVQDNKILTDNDPNYTDNIKLATADKPWLLKAWLDGDWDITAGGMFDDLWNRKIHVINPFPVPPNWPIYRSYDWGSSKPFSIGWWTKANGEAIIHNNQTMTPYPGTMIRVGEWYGWNGTPNKGLNMVETEIAKGIKEKEKMFGGHKIFDGPADDSIFDVVNGKSLASEHEPQKIYWQRAGKGKGSRVAGWQRIRQMLKASLSPHPEEAGLFTFDTCRQFIRTVPTLPRSDTNLDDVNTNSEDHAGDETRYMLKFSPNQITKEKLSGF